MSNKTMTLTDISKTSKQFKDIHTLQVGGFKDGGRRLTAADVQKELRESVDIILKEIKVNNQALLNAIRSLQKEFYSFKNYVEDEFKKNKLFQEHVEDEFKKNKLFQEHVEDVFKKNKLFQEHVEAVFERNNLK